MWVGITIAGVRVRVRVSLRCGWASPSLVHPNSNPIPNPLTLTLTLDTSVLTSALASTLMLAGYGCALAHLSRAILWLGVALEAPGWEMDPYYDVFSFKIPSYVPSAMCLFLLLPDCDRERIVEVNESRLDLFFDTSGAYEMSPMSSPKSLSVAATSSRFSLARASAVRRTLAENEKGEMESLLVVPTPEDTEKVHLLETLGPPLVIEESICSSAYSLSIPAEVLQERHQVVAQRWAASQA